MIINLSAVEAFASVYGTDEDGSPQGNFMTPTALSYYATSDASGFIELSVGLGLFGEELYGVTVIERSEDGGWIKRLDLNRSHRRLATAMAYIRSLDGVHVGPDMEAA